ncbi:MAG: ABC transporter permease [Planctomycetota bacterium]
MASKSYLVARREYVENLRTKAFWIGIMAFPVLYAVIILVAVLLHKAKDVRKYVVLDESGWLLAAMEEPVPDLWKLFDEVKRVKAGETDGVEELSFYPEVLDRGYLGELLDKTDKGQVSVLATALSEFQKHLPEIESIDRTHLEAVLDSFRGILPENVDPETVVDWIERVPREFHELRGWLGELPAEQANRYSRTSRSDDFERIDYQGDEKGLRQMIGQEEIFAYFVVPKDPVGAPPPLGRSDNGAARESSKTPGFKYVSKNVADKALKKWFQREATKLIRERRIEKLEMPKQHADWIGKGIRFDEKKVSAAGTEEKVKTKDYTLQLAPVGFVYALWIAIFIMAQMLLTNTIEEKSNRIIEVLLSSVSPLQLMSGKIAGLAFTGLTVVGSWLFFFVLGIKILPLVNPAIGEVLDKIALEGVIRNPAFVLSFLIYFILGYVFYAALYCGIGSVFNSLKEAQNMVTPLALALIVPLLTMMPIAENPNGTLARVMSYIPLFTPFVMMNRVGGSPPLLDYLGTSVILLAAVALMFWASAKVFRIGILMTGKPPRIREILRWVRAPVGTVAVRKE